MENTDLETVADFLGYSVAGPLAVEIAYWLLKECKKRDIPILYLCGRDSRLIHTFFSDFLKPVELEVLYLETSRTAMQEFGGQKYTEYFGRVSKFESKSAIFDLSWMGSALEIHKTSFPDRDWFGFNLRSISKSENISFFDPQGFSLGRKSIQIYKMRDFFELLLTDSCPRTVTYLDGYPIYASISITPRTDIIRFIHIGALKYMKDFDHSEETPPESSLGVLNLVKQVWEKPSNEMKNLLLHLNVEENSFSKHPRRFTVNNWSDFRIFKPVVMPQASKARGTLPLLLKIQQDVFYFLSFLRFLKKRLVKVNIFFKINLNFLLRSKKTKTLK